MNRAARGTAPRARLGEDDGARHAGAAGGADLGTAVFWDGEQVQVDESYAEAEPRGILSGWQGPAATVFSGVTAGPLTKEAAGVQEEFTRLSGLFEANRAVGRGQTFAVRGVLTPLTDDELAELHGG